MPAGFPRRPRRKDEKAPSSLVIRNVVVAGRRTSVRLEPAMWDALQDIAERLQRSVHDIVTTIDGDRTTANLTAAIRVYIVDFYRAAAMQNSQPQPTLPTGLQP